MTEAEIKQCKILTMVLQKVDVDKFKDRALRVLDENPDNPFAYMIYNADFNEFYNQGRILSIQFNESFMIDFLKEHFNTLGIEIFLAITPLILKKETCDESDDVELINLVLNYAEAVITNGSSLLSFYDMTVNLLCDNIIIRQLERIINDDDIDGFSSAFLRACNAIKAREIMINEVLKKLESTNTIAPEKKTELINIIKKCALYKDTTTSNQQTPVQNQQATVSNQQPEQKSKRGLYIGIGIGVAIILLILFFF